MEMETCRLKNVEILHIIRVSSLSQKTMDTYSNELQNVLVILNNLASMSEIIELLCAANLVKIQSILNAILKNIVTLSNLSKLEKFLSKGSLKRKTKTLFSQLRQEVSLLEGNSQSTLYSPIAKSTNSVKRPEVLPINRESQNENLPNQKLDFVWNHMFGEESLVVSWDEFVRVLRLKTPFDEMEEVLLKSIIDNSNTGSVTRNKLSEFLKSFGPISDCVRNVVNISSSPWFHGYMTSEESQKYLETERIGTFLVRFSSSKAGAFALDYVRAVDVNNVDQPLYGPMEPSSFIDNNLSESDYGTFLSKKVVSSVLIESVGIGFKLKENYGDKLFKTLFDVLNQYKKVLYTPFTSTLSSESWFHGNMNSEEAEDALRDQRPGTFLIRFSSQPGCFASSFVNYEGRVCKSLIKRVPKGFTFEHSETTKVYSTIKELVKEFQENNLFLFPLNSFARNLSKVPSSNSSFLSTPTSTPSSLQLEWGMVIGERRGSITSRRSTISSLCSEKDDMNCFRYLRTEVQDWTVEDVANWLDVINLSQIKPVFEHHQINGIALLDLSELDMRDELQLVIGVRKQLLKSVQRFM